MGKTVINHPFGNGRCVLIGLSYSTIGFQFHGTYAFGMELGEPSRLRSQLDLQKIETGKRGF